MKILYFVNGLNYKGGIARIVVDKANYLADYYNHDVTICTINGSRYSAYLLSKKVQVVKLNDSNMQRDGLLGKFWGVVCSVKGIYDIISKLHPDVIDNAQTQIITWFLPYLYRHIPKVMEIHFSRVGMRYNIAGQSSLFKWLYFKLVEFTYRRYDRFVCLTDEDAAYWPCRNVGAIGNFTNIDSKISDLTNKTIVCVARYHVQKRLDLLVDAWALITDRNPGWKVEIYGMGPEKQALQNKINRMELSDSFILNDAVDDVAKVLSESSIMALTSEHEGFCLALLEAMKVGIPVCCFEIVGIHCAVDDESTGLLCNFGDVNAFAGNLERLMRDPKLRFRLRNNALKRQEAFSKNNIMAQWNNLFNNIIKE